ncbi:MAG: PQQ-binding-like beta-propeller repeat protein, partial [Planctomycetota bacterium]
SGTPAKVVYDPETGKKKGDLYVWFTGFDLVNTSTLSCMLDNTGITAINRAKHSANTKKINTIEGELRGIRSKVKDLKRKLNKAGKAKSEKIDKQINQLTARAQQLSQEREALKESLSEWKYENKNLCCLIAAGNTIYSGGQDQVMALDPRSGKEIWQAEVEGKACGLAASDGRLYVSTDKGCIYCFASEKVDRPEQVKIAEKPAQFPNDRLTPVYQAAAEAIIQQADIQKGYALVLGCGTGRLAYELAKGADLKIIGIEKDPEKRALARKYLETAGMYGARVVVESWDPAILPDYFANLIVCDELMVSGGTENLHKDLLRILRPCGGVAIFGQPAAAAGIAKPLDADQLARWLNKNGAPAPKVVRENGLWVKTTRGKLAGTDNWTHIYGNPQNTASSEDQLIKCPLGVLWFGEPGPEKIVERHGRPTAPLSVNGRLFIQGQEVIIACDAYNGTILWEKEIPEAVRARVDVYGGSMAATENGVYVPAGDKCYRLDPASGEVIRTYRMPESADGGSRKWSYVAGTDDILFGSLGLLTDWEYDGFWKAAVRNGQWRSIDEIPEQYKGLYKQLTAGHPTPDEHIRADMHRKGAKWGGLDAKSFPAWFSQRSPTNARNSRMLCSDSIFAVNVETGKSLWVHRGKEISNITNTIGDGVIFFAENKVTQEQKENALREKEKLINSGVYEPSEKSDFKPQDIDVRLLIALDVKTGQKIWERPVDLTECGGNKMGLAYQDGFLLCFGHFSNHDRGYFNNNQLTWRRITTLNAKNGEMVWSRSLNYLRRPVIVGDTIIIEPRACDLRTGKIKMRSHPITGEPVTWEFLRPGHSCGVTSASPNFIFYRSYCGAIYDLKRDSGLRLFGGIRPGCWLNVIPAGGLLLSPESSSGCTCSFPIKCSVALKHKPQKKIDEWSVFITNGNMTPAKHFAINLGAPGDTRDENGRLWFGYPRPKTFYGKYGVKFDLQEVIAEGMGYFCRDYQGVDIEGSNSPWLFTSGCLGLIKCEVPLLNPDAKDKEEIYTVRLGFAAPEKDKVGQRIFDIKLQGEIIAEDFDILQAAGGMNKAVVKEIPGIRVKDKLIVELTPKISQPTTAQMPVINFIEVVSGKYQASNR